MEGFKSEIHFHKDSDGFKAVRHHNFDELVDNFVKIHFVAIINFSIMYGFLTLFLLFFLWNSLKISTFICLIEGNPLLRSTKFFILYFFWKYNKKSYIWCLLFSKNISLCDLNWFFLFRMTSLFLALITHFFQTFQ